MNARDEAVEMIRRICPPHLSADEYGQILAEKLDAYRAEVNAEALHAAADAAEAIHQKCHRDRDVCAGCQVRADILDVLRSAAAVIGEQYTVPGSRGICRACGRPVVRFVCDLTGGGWMHDVPGDDPGSGADHPAVPVGPAPDATGRTYTHTKDAAT